MIRTYQKEDLPALVALCQQCFGGETGRVEAGMVRWAGQGEVLVAEENGAPVGMLILLPCTLAGHSGTYLYTLCVAPAARHKGLAGQLLQCAAEEARKAGRDFLILTPEQQTLVAWYEKLGFTSLFSRRLVERPVKRNLWAQADFDSLTPRAYNALRASFFPDEVRLPEAAFAALVQELYSDGATVVSTKEGCGLYFREGATLHFRELLAKNDAAAENLLEAARQRESIVEQAQISVDVNQTLFAGEGRREVRAMVRFLGEPFEPGEAHFGLLPE